MVRSDRSLSLFTARGQRKYLTRKERDLFLRAASTCSPDKYLLCQTLAFTGCRLSEALTLTPLRICAETNTIVFETLKQRRASVFREIPVPPQLIASFKDLYGDALPGKRYWQIHRQTAWRWIKIIMQQAELSGTSASPKGLRHGFAVHAIQRGIPLTLVQKWLGHSDMETTSIYTNVMGKEERQFARKMWA